MSQNIEKAIQDYQLKHGVMLDLRAVLFDMDGVLFHSMPNHAQAWVSAFKAFGLEIPIEEAYMNEGSTALATAKNLFAKYLNIDITPEKSEEIKQYKHKIMESLPTSTVMPAMQELVSITAQHGVDRWVVTGSAQGILIDRLEKEYNGLLDRNKMVTAHDVKIGKPHPEPYLMALAKSGYQAHQVIVVENAPLGVESGKAAGLFTIGLNSGPLKPEVLLNAGADLLFHNSAELLAAWPKVLKKMCKVNQRAFI
jgi:HAD superfamily hydrolase (TIGR01509 family)